MTETTRTATPDEVAAWLEMGRALGGESAGAEPALSMHEALERAAQRAYAKALEKVEDAA